MALVVVLMAAVRVQYAPLALLLLGVFFLRTEKKVQLVVAAGVFLLAVGVFDAITWDGGLFHSYITNIRFNLLIDEGRAGETPIYQFLWWLLLASVGLSALCMVIALRDLRRYGLLFVLINEVPVRQWEAYNPIIGGVEQIMKHVDPNAPTPPLNSGIRFTTESK